VDSIETASLQFLSVQVCSASYVTTTFWGKKIVFFLLPEAFCGLKYAEYAENAIAAGAPLGELTTLPQTP